MRQIELLEIPIPESGDYDGLLRSISTRQSSTKASPLKTLILQSTGPADESAAFQILVTRLEFLVPEFYVRKEWKDLVSILFISVPASY